MKAKLIKIQDKYYISTHNQTNLCYHLKHKELLEVKGVGEKSGEVHHDKGWSKPNEVLFIDVEAPLSFKNCQVLENGYDLDELIKDEVKALIWGNSDSYAKGIWIGFQRALELVGDKRFTEDDVLKVVTHVLNKLVLVEGFDKQFLFPESIYQEATTKCKSLQKTEWDVEVEMEWKPFANHCDQCGEGGKYMETPCDHPNDCLHWSPKLDADGCIILKRI